MTTAVLILSVSALIFTVIQNRRLALRLAALADAQTVTENRLDRLSKKTRRTTNKQRQFDRKLEQQRKRQERISKAQEQIKKEQRKQAQSISKLSFRISQAESDIAAGMDRLSQLFALLDIAEANRAAAMPGTAQDVRYQKQIVSLTAQIASTERRIEKARFDRSQAQEGLAA